jgi:hypothetical protein
MFQNSCTEMAWKLNRIVHSQKKAKYLAGLISLCFLPVCALMGRFVVPSGVENYLGKGSAVIASGARASFLSLHSFPMQR